MAMSVQWLSRYEPCEGEEVGDLASSALEVWLDAERQRRLSELPATRGVSPLKVVRDMIGQRFEEALRADRARAELMAFLESRGLETRPIVAGSVAEQPGLRLFPHRSVGDLANSRLIHRNCFYFGNHQGIGCEEREALAGAHVITVPPQFMSKMIDHHYSRATVQQFNADAQKALARMGELKAGAESLAGARNPNG